MVRRSYTPDRGDIAWVDFGLVQGHEQAGLRPAFVVSSRLYNSPSGLVLVCPITSRIKGYTFEVQFSIPKVHGAILADHARSIDWKKRKMRFIGKAMPDTIEAVIKRIKVLIEE